jgi:Domain of unknown function (DUF4267)
MIGWMLSILMSLALVAIGAAAVVAPRTASSQFGIVSADPRALGFVRAMGVRDVALGILLTLLALERAREGLAWAMFAMALVAVVDFAVVTVDRRAVAATGNATRGVDRSRYLHAAGAIGLLVTGAVLHAGL